MGIFSRAYEPGGKHHLPLTDEAFQEAQRCLESDPQLERDYAKWSEELGCRQYEAHDFPVSRILGNFLLAYEIQEKKSAIPENLRMANIQLGRKDQVELEKFIKRYNDRIQMAIEDKESSWNEKGVGGKLFSFAVNAAAKGIAKAATGKSAEMREFEKHFSDYICGESSLARDCLAKYAGEFGPGDEGILSLAKAIRMQFWTAEFARYNREK